MIYWYNQIRIDDYISFLATIGYKKTFILPLRNIVKCIITSSQPNFTKYNFHFYTYTLNYIPKISPHEPHGYIVCFITVNSPNSSVGRLNFVIICLFMQITLLIQILYLVEQLLLMKLYIISDDKYLIPLTPSALSYFLSTEP